MAFSKDTLDSGAPISPGPRAGPIIPPGQALWNQRARIAAARERLRALSAAVGRPTACALFQWAQLAAFALEFRPDLVIELGRERGNSTCCFLQAASQLGGPGACRVVSLCLSDDWFMTTLPRLKPLVPAEWLAPAEIRQCNILDYDFAPAVDAARRCLVFWDAHGFEVAEWVLGKLGPRLVGKPHAILMHDMSDLRYETGSPAYGEQGLWKGANAAEPSFWLGHIFSRVAQAISVVDFSSRNRLPLHSAAESLHRDIATDPARLLTLRQLLGEDLFSLQGHWFWFSLNEAPGPLTFPRFTLRGEEARQDNAQRNAEAIRHAVETIEQEVAQLRANLAPAERLEASGRLAPLENALAPLRTALAVHQQELAVLCRGKREAERDLQEIKSSAGWRLLNAWRGLRERLAPSGTLRRKLYDSGMMRLRGAARQS